MYSGLVAHICMKKNNNGKKIKIVPVTNTWRWAHKRNKGLKKIETLQHILRLVEDHFDLSTQLPGLRMRARLRRMPTFSQQYNSVTHIYLPPFKQGRWHTGLWHWFPLQSAEHIQTLGLTHFPPLKHDNLHTGNWHWSPTYSAGHLHTFPNKHNPPFWHLGEQGAETYTEYQ